jgi:glycosyltransferase involved in cell wall biosynthesis
MKLLFLSHYFPPEVNAPASRTFDHCREWVKQGHSVTVVTCQPNHPQGKLYPGFKNHWFYQEEIEGIQVIRLWTWLSANAGFGGRILNYLLFMVVCIINSYRFPKVDIVMSTSPQFFCGLAGYFVSRIKAVPWVLEIRDLWPESIVTVGAMKDGLWIKALYGLERFCYLRAATIVTVTDAFKAYMIEKGIDQNKIHVVKNGVDTNLFHSESDVDTKQVDTFCQRYDLHNKFTAAYVGTHGMAHKLETILRCAKKLKYRDDIRILMVGDGSEWENIKALKDQWQLQNVIMTGQLPKSMMPVVWAASDVSLVHLAKSDTFKSVIPSKLFESFAMAKPIILGVEGESAEIVRESQSGVCVEPENHISLAEAIIKLCDDKSYYRSLSENGPGYVRKNYDRKRLAQDLLSVLLVQINPKHSDSAAAMSKD